MSRLLLFAVLLIVLLGATPSVHKAHAQANKCDVAADFVVQAREQARPGLRRADADNMLSLLKTATEMCTSSSDAWYYRYLYALQVNDKRDAQFALGRARRGNAEGLRRQTNPFAPVATATTSAAALPRVVRQKWALVIGIGQFQSPKINPLKYTAKDARDFAELLTHPSYGRFKPANVTLLTDAQATTIRIKSELERLSEVAAPDDLVVLYLSTHGSPRDMSRMDINYLITYDTIPERLYTTALPMVDVTKDAQRMVPATRMVILLDTCFSGAATQAGTYLGGATTLSAATGGAAEGVKAMNFVSSVSRDLLASGNTSAGLARVTISASQPSERSWESAELKNGIFTYYLIDALKQNAGMNPIGTVFQTLRDRVEQRVRMEKKQSQRPMIEPPDAAADICLGVSPQTK